MKRLGHSYLSLLKVDIEGSEWEVFANLLPKQPAEGHLHFGRTVGEVSIELHYKDVDSAFEFFEGMDRHGFRIFSRETNYHPCVTGRGLPVAIEYSFVQHAHPTPAIRSPHTAVRDETGVSAAIFVLMQSSRIPVLRRMLASLEQNFTSRFNYPVVLFTDEQLSPSVQQSLAASMKSTQLRFHYLSFEVPAFLNSSAIPERTLCSPQSSTIGYRNMCRFMSQRVHATLDEMGYEWHMR